MRLKDRPKRIAANVESRPPENNNTHVSDDEGIAENLDGVMLAENWRI
jgi:hypothetical protein